MESHEDEIQPLVTKSADKEEEAPSRREEAAVVKEDESRNEDKVAATEMDSQQQQGFSSQHIYSIKTAYDENPLLSINKPTSAPQNTPVQSPPASPNSSTTKEEGSKLSGMPVSFQSISSSLPRLPPPPVPVSASRAEGASDGGTEPPNANHVGGAKDGKTGEEVEEEEGNNEGRGGGEEGAEEGEEDSPISIMNRRNIFATSDSRSSSASKQVAGPPAKEHLKTNSEEGDSSNSNSNSLGVAPQSFYFDKDRSVTDPHVKLEPNDQKINISSWRSGANDYSLIEGVPEGEDENRSKSNSKSNSRSSPRGSETNGPAKISNGIDSSPNGNNNNNNNNNNNDDDDNYVPPPPPRYINSKLDDIRSRLLLNPRTVSPRSDEDIDKTHAAAVLSNMRSSPFRLSDRPTSLSSSRPSSSSFSGKGYARPVIRIHHREEPSGDQDDNAVLDDEEDEEDEEGQEDENGNERVRHSSTSKVVSAPIPARRKEVTWNKNGKRVSRRLSAPETRRTKTKKIKIESGKDSSIPRNGEEIDDTYSPHEVMENENDNDNEHENENEEEEEEEYEDGKTSNKSKKNSMGSRSRTGCWICRLRKKKCTEERPRCYNCDRLNLDCFYDVMKPDFVSNPQKKQMKLEEIKKKTKEAKRNAMRKKPGANP